MQIEIKQIIIKEPAMSQALATAELQKWFDYKQLGIELVEAGNKTDDDFSDEENGGIEETAIITAIMKGHLIIDEEFNMTYKLLFPVKDDSGSVALSELKMVPRLTAAQVQLAIKGTTRKEPMKMFPGYISVLSGEVRGIINKIDSVDFSLLQKVAGYFL